MNTKTQAERTKKYRYMKRIENTALKLQKLIREAPNYYDPTETDLEFLVADILAEMLNTEFHFVHNDDYLGFLFLLPEENRSTQNPGEVKFWVSQSTSEEQYEDQLKLERLNKQKGRKPARITLNSFAEKSLGAKTTNPRWSWVATTEASNGKPGKLFLFAWDHIGPTGPGAKVKLFKQEVEPDESGRRPPGHRDALEQIEKVLKSELTPYLVWQYAEDPNAKKLSLRSINTLFVNECELYIDKDGYWTAKIGAKVAVQELHNPSGVVGT